MLNQKGGRQSAANDIKHIEAECIALQNECYTVDMASNILCEYFDDDNDNYPYSYLHPKYDHQSNLHKKLVAASNDFANFANITNAEGLDKEKYIESLKRFIVPCFVSASVFNSMLKNGLLDKGFRSRLAKKLDTVKTDDKFKESYANDTLLTKMADAEILEPSQDVLNEFKHFKRHTNALVGCFNKLQNIDGGNIPNDLLEEISQHASYIVTRNRSVENSAYAQICNMPSINNLLNARYDKYINLLNKSNDVRSSITKYNEFKTDVLRHLLFAIESQQEGYDAYTRTRNEDFPIFNKKIDAYRNINKIAYSHITELDLAINNILRIRSNNLIAKSMLDKLPEKENEEIKYLLDTAISKDIAREKKAYEEQLRGLKKSMLDLKELKGDLDKDVAVFRAQLADYDLSLQAAGPISGLVSEAGNENESKKSSPESLMARFEEQMASPVIRHIQKHEYNDQLDIDNNMYDYNHKLEDIRKRYDYNISRLTEFIKKENDLREEAESFLKHYDVVSDSIMEKIAKLKSDAAISGSPYDKAKEAELKKEKYLAFIDAMRNKERLTKEATLVFRSKITPLRQDIKIAKAMMDAHALKAANNNIESNNIETDNIEADKDKKRESKFENIKNKLNKLRKSKVSPDLGADINADANAAVNAGKQSDRLQNDELQKEGVKKVSFRERVKRGLKKISCVSCDSVSVM